MTRVSSFARMQFVSCFVLSRVCASPSKPNRSTLPCEAPGTISGTVVDPNGNFVVSAQVTLVLEGHPGQQEVVSNADGRFVFTNLPAGPFQLTITATSFATRLVPGFHSSWRDARDTGPLAADCGCHHGGTSQRQG